MSSSFATISPDAIFTAGALLVGLFVLRWMRNRNGGSDPDAGLKNTATAGNATNRPQSPPASLDQWEVRMHEVARDLSAQLDTKIRIVQQLVLRAEQQSARLEAALDRAEQTREPGITSPDSRAASGHAEESELTSRMPG